MRIYNACYRELEARQAKLKYFKYKRKHINTILGLFFTELNVYSLHIAYPEIFSLFNGYGSHA